MYIKVIMDVTGLDGWKFGIERSNQLMSHARSQLPSDLYTYEKLREDGSAKVGNDFLSDRFFSI
jgi:hypothetical protein